MATQTTAQLLADLFLSTDDGSDPIEFFDAELPTMAASARATHRRAFLALVEQERSYWADDEETYLRD